jgi:quercetin dioxygenase-like cupin family protein
MLHLVMKPGSVIPAHIHGGVAEVLYVMEGDFINEGKQHLPGTSLHVKPGQVHGPHTTKRAATFSCSGQLLRRTKPTSAISQFPKSLELDR